MTPPHERSDLSSPSTTSVDQSISHVPEDGLSNSPRLDRLSDSQRNTSRMTIINLGKKFSDSALNLLHFTSKNVREDSRPSIYNTVKVESEPHERRRSRSRIRNFGRRRRATSELEPPLPSSQSEIFLPGREQQGHTLDDSPDPLLMESLDDDQITRNRSTARSTSFHLDRAPDGSEEAVFDPNPYGFPSYSSLCLQSSPSSALPVSTTESHGAESGRQLGRHELELRSCCEACIQATMLGFNDEHEIRFSDRALELYMARSDSPGQPPPNSLNTQSLVSLILPQSIHQEEWRRPLRNSLTRRSSTHKTDQAEDIPPVPSLPSNLNLLLETGTDRVPSPPRSMEAVSDPKVEMGMTELKTLPLVPALIKLETASGAKSVSNALALRTKTLALEPKCVRRSIESPTTLTLEVCMQ